jgi:RNA-directed DNA polymerase
MQQLSLFEEPTKTKIELIDLYNAYFSCRKNKRNTANALAFEVDYEYYLYELWEQINDGSYEVGRSIAFMVTKPVLREIFAADFRDRVVHHLLIGKLNALFEQQFIYDSYSCRVGKGTHFGVQRVDKFIRKCSQNYSRDCYVLKLDIEGFFMHINKPILFERLVQFIEQKYHETDKALLIALFRKVIFNDASKNCIVKGKRSDWDDLPKSKSLFHTKELTGLPIGNLTSQILANIYMDSFDHFVKHDLRIKYYGRYVDDFIIVHEDKTFLKSLLPILSEFLSDNLKLKIHP